MIDETDHKILKILQEKARIPNVEVARRVGMAPSGVLERIRKLEKRGVIDGYEVRLNPEFFERSLVAFVTVSLCPGADETAAGQALSDIPEVQEVHFVAGKDAFLVKLRVADPPALGRLLRQNIAAAPGVSRTRTATALTTYKESARIPIDNVSEE
jgi:Lrp/AsnC family leucine-responsive transcriptional regulator